VRDLQSAEPPSGTGSGPPPPGAPASGPPPLTPNERRLRRALIATAALMALLAVFVGVVIVYWVRYVLPTKPDPFTRGPYLVQVGTTTATLRWRVAGRPRVEIVATTPDGRTVASTDGHLRGLAPGARQGWVAVVDGRARASGTVTTAPTDPRASIRFTAFGDYGAGGEDERAVGRVAAAQQPAFTVVPGDNSYLAAAPPLFDHNIFAPMRALLAEGPFIATLGEHDLAWFGGRAVARALGLPNGGNRYVWDYGPLRFVLLGLDADRADLAVLRSALARPGARHVYVVVHRPPGHGNPVLAAARGRVTAVLAGHNHRYERRVVDGVPVLTVGTGGAPRSGDESLTPRSADAAASLAVFGVLRVDDRPGRVVMAFIDSAGRVRDRLVMR
jgi:Calcineurin-like phosphoesterase